MKGKIILQSVVSWSITRTFVALHLFGSSSRVDKSGPATRSTRICPSRVVKPPIATRAAARSCCPWTGTPSRSSCTATERLGRPGDPENEQHACALCTSPMLFAPLKSPASANMLSNAKPPRMIGRRWCATTGFQALSSVSPTHNVHRLAVVENDWSTCSSTTTRSSSCRNACPPCCWEGIPALLAEEEANPVLLAEEEAVPAL